MTLVNIYSRISISRSMEKAIASIIQKADHYCKHAVTADEVNGPCPLASHIIAPSATYKL